MLFHSPKSLLQSCSRSWQPSHLSGTATDIMTLDEILGIKKSSKKSLQEVLLVNNAFVNEIADVVTLFPNDVKLTVVCKSVSM